MWSCFRLWLFVLRRLGSLTRGAEPLAARRVTGRRVCVSQCQRGDGDDAMCGASLLAGLGLLLGALLSCDAQLCRRLGCNCSASPRAGPQWIVADCVFAPGEAVELGAGSAPANLLELRVSGGGELRLLPGALAGAARLSRVDVSGVGRLLLRRRSFAGAGAGGGDESAVEAADCEQVVIETGAFAELGAALSVALERVGHVVLQANAFARLRVLAVARVHRLEMQPYALALPPQTSSASTVVRLSKVMMAELPPHAFPSPLAELRLEETHVRTVRRDAFSAMLLDSLVIVNCSLDVVEGGAFSSATLFESLRMENVRVRVLAPDALLSAATNLSVSSCRLSEILEGAINSAVATATLEGNVFESVAARGLVLREWNRLLLLDNSFGRLGADALWAPFHPAAPSPKTARYEFTFAGNRVSAPGAASALRFVDDAAAAVWKRSGFVTLERNSFAQACSCDLGAALGAGRLAASALCAVVGGAARCLGLQEGAVAALSNYSATLCGNDAAPCEEAAAGRVVAENDSDGGGVGILPALLLAVALLGAAALTGAVWLRRRGRTFPCVAILSRRRARHCSPPASPRPPAHVYAELRPPDAAADADDDDEGGQLPGASEDRWTQTPPEELTAELLASLREKLDDPDNYAQARDVIEHLYDLVKVEESGSDSTAPRGGSARRGRGGRPSTRSRGTSPTPLRRLLSPDYAEPSDARPHVYTELPASSMASRPLPPPPRL